ncbi:MAG: phenylacetate--CoA ligase family protein [Candidatus Omnitrophica bacterium]|nr:phenylacetate--CoA ligase family protein [Candidatus Omnitrophota bacterium]
MIDSLGKISIVKMATRYARNLIPLKTLLGKDFFRKLDFLEKSQWWSSQELENYQNEHLQALIHHAYNNVPYYHEVFRTNKLTPSDIHTVHDLPKLPILTKDIVRARVDDLKAKNFKDNDLIRSGTSGTTGTPLVFFTDQKLKVSGFHGPFIWRHFGWGGHRIGERRAIMSGWALADRRPVFYHPVNRVLVLSSYTLNPVSAELYARKLRSYRIQYIEAYPSIIGLFTRLLKDRNIARPVDMKAIFCFAEYLSDWQREEIESFWGCECFDRYGLNEGVVQGIECEKHEGLHLASEYGITEFIDNENGYKNIVATGLTNYAMPFIRYETGDIGRLSERKCSCERGFPLFELSGGRRRNFAVGKDNAAIPIANVTIPKVTDQVVEFQFIQEEKGKMTLRLVRKTGFRAEDLKKIEKELDEKFRDNLEVTIEFSDSVFKTANRKTPVFIQKLVNIQS